MLPDGFSIGEFFAAENVKYIQIQHAEIMQNDRVMLH